MLSHEKRNQSTHQSVIAHIQNKPSTRDRIDFEKKMVQEMSMILDFGENSCKNDIIKCTEWDLQTRVRIGFVFAMTSLCDEVILWIICYPVMKDFIKILNTWFMIFTNDSAFSFMSETLRCVSSYTIRMILIWIWILLIWRINWIVLMFWYNKWS